MDFGYTETQRMLASSVERLLTEARRRDDRDAGGEDGVWAALASLGLMGVEIEEALGGSGGTFEDMAAVLQPMGAALVTAPFVTTAVLAAGLLARGTTAQKTRWLPSLAAGRLRVCVAHAERRARETLSWVETSAKFDGELWRLSGHKAVAMGGNTADLYLVSARTTGDAHQAQGISLFIVPRATDGLRISAYTLYDGSGAADLALEDLLLPRDALLGLQDAAYPELALAWDRGTAAICVESIGVMDKLRDITVDYLKTREQFGHPIGQFQALQHRMVDAYMAIELARSMSLLAVAAIEESEAGVRAANVSAAKVMVSDACREVGQTCVQLHGGIALTEDYAAGRYFKRLTMIERLFGNAEHHLNRYAGI